MACWIIFLKLYNINETFYLLFEPPYIVREESIKVG